MANLAELNNIGVKMKSTAHPVFNGRGMNNQFGNSLPNNSTTAN